MGLKVTLSTRLSKKNWFEREGMKRRMKRECDDGRGDGWMKKGMPELLLYNKKGLMNKYTRHKDDYAPIVTFQ